MEGRTLSHYRILEKIGAGGMGVVYRAHDERLDRDVALKVLPSWLLADEGARHRFRNEALALSKLNHPNIAVIHDFDRHGGVDFLVMEYVRGMTLSEKLARGPLPEPEVAELGAQIASALQEAHERGIVHRDLKPGNILVTPKNQAKVLDFGLAKLLHPVAEDSLAQTRTQTQAAVGTLPYMAPEQLRAETVDARSDVFALGAVLYEAVTGQRAFPGKSALLVAESILHDDPKAPRELNPLASRNLERIILKCLQKRPVDRYQSAADLEADLKQVDLPGAVVARPRRLRPVLRAGIWASAALAAVAGLTALNVLVWHRDTEDSLAVLPMANESPGAETEYLSDGMTESLISNLSQLPGLKVIARASVFRYKGRPIDPRIVGKELGVRAILTGRLTRRGDDLAVSAELVDAVDGRRLWGADYDSRFSDVLAVQEQIASQVSGILRVKLTGEERQRLAKRQTQDVEAYQLYLQGRHYLGTYSEAALRSGLERFKQAIDLDPGYALAYVGMAETYYYMSNVFLPPGEAMPRAREAARKALQIDDTLAEAHAVLALVTSQYDWQWEAAEKLYDRAIRLNPGHAPTYVWYGTFLVAMERPAEAASALRRAKDLDPLSTYTSWCALWPHIYAPPNARRYDLAIQDAQTLLKIDPTYYPTHLFLGFALELTGQVPRAIAEFEKATELSKEAPYTLALLAHAYAVAGEHTDARRVLGRLEELRRREHVGSYHLALVHAGLGERDRAFEFLEKALEERDEELVWVKVDPRLDDLRADPRFANLLHRLGFQG